MDYWQPLVVFSSKKFRKMFWLRRGNPLAPLLIAGLISDNRKHLTDPAIAI
jgi:hypothetical protein